MTWFIALLLAVVSLTPAWKPLQKHQAGLLSRKLPAINRTMAGHVPAPMPRPAQTAPPNLQASASYAVDLESAAVLFNRHADKPLPIASITKLVTAMVILESHDLNEDVTIPPLPPYRAEDAKLGLVPGQRFKLQDLLQAALIPSANDAADALAIYDSGSLDAFANKMNNLTAKWGIGTAHFTTASGLVETNNYASAEALARLAKIALHHPDFKRWAATPSTRITTLDGQAFDLFSTNRLLQDQRFTGIKTGYTPAAGQSLLTLVTIKGRPVITVVLNSPDRFGETTALADWIEANYEWY
jgi:serine-type D-Ala-D-Ala carboxypeptidase (penicillin-binding protein 5/6)